MKAPPHDVEDILGPVRSRKKGKTFRHGNEEWDVYFELYENGYMPVVSRLSEEKIISLLLSKDNVKATVKKLNDLDERIDNMTFGFFRDIVAGAASLSMKYE